MGHPGGEPCLHMGWMPPHWQTMLSKLLKILKDQILLGSPSFAFLSSCFSYCELKIRLNLTENEFGVTLCFYFYDQTKSYVLIGMYALDEKSLQETAREQKAVIWS